MTMCAATFIKMMTPGRGGEALNLGLKTSWDRAADCNMTSSERY